MSSPGSKRSGRVFRAVARGAAAAAAANRVVVDHSGVERLSTALEQLAEIEDPGRLPPELVEEARRADLPHFRLHLALMLVILGSGCISVLCSFLLGVGATTFVALIMRFAWVPAVSFNIYYLWRRRARPHQYYLSKSAEALVPVLLRHGLCGACMYPLEGQVADAQGLTMCPECGARWRAAAGGARA